MRLLTWNICRDDLPVAGVAGWASRRTHVFDLIRKAAPDVVALQEATPRQLRDLDLHLRPYRRVGSSPDRSIHTHRNAIYVNPEAVTVRDAGHFPIPGHPSTVSRVTTPRTVNWARVGVGTREVVIASIHLDPVQQSARIEAAQEIVDTLPDAILLGDFNDKPNGPVYEVFRRRGWDDVWSFANDDPELHFGTFHYRGHTTRARPDWMLMPPRWQDTQTSSAYSPVVGDDQIGDHSALLADVEFSVETDALLSHKPTPEELREWAAQEEIERAIDEHLAALEGIGPPTLAAPPTPEPTPLSQADLFERLRQWRLQQSRQEGVPAYIVAQDSILHTIAAVRPRNVEQLRRVKGMGPTRSEKYGQTILDIVAAVS